jgi:hypothetical protein
VREEEMKEVVILISSHGCKDIEFVSQPKSIKELEHINLCVENEINRRAFDKVLPENRYTAEQEAWNNKERPRFEAARTCAKETK